MSRKTLLLRICHRHPAVAVGGLSGAIAFGTAKPPPRMISIDAKAAEAEGRDAASRPAAVSPPATEASWPTALIVPPRSPPPRPSPS